MKQAWLLMSLLGFTVNLAFAQASRSSLLWEISGNGLTAPSHIYGSFHILCKDDFSIPEVLETKIRNSRQFFGELDMDDPTLQQQMAIKMQMPGKTLASLMSGDSYQKLSVRFQEIMGMPLEMFAHFKPFMCLSLLAINSISCNNRVQPETELLKLAKQYHIPVKGLETLDDEMNAIDKEPLDSQIISLQRTLYNFDSVKNVMAEMKSVYQLRDIDSLNRFIRQKGSGDVFERELLVKRNLNWLPVITKAMKDQATFFVVGAGHLGGDDGIIYLLKKQGFRVNPVFY